VTRTFIAAHQTFSALASQNAVAKPLDKRQNPRSAKGQLLLFFRPFVLLSVKKLQGGRPIKIKVLAIGKDFYCYITAL
jgi:hypothetical protein